MDDVQRLEEQEAKIEITPYYTPWEVACMLINAEYEREHFFTKEKYMSKYFDNEDLRRIGEHIINYCNTEMSGDNG